MQTFKVAKKISQHDRKQKMQKIISQCFLDRHLSLQKGNCSNGTNANGMFWSRKIKPSLVQKFGHFRQS